MQDWLHIYKCFYRPDINCSYVHILLVITRICNSEIKVAKKNKVQKLPSPHSRCNLSLDDNRLCCQLIPPGKGCWHGGLPKERRYLIKPHPLTSAHSFVEERYWEQVPFNFFQVYSGIFHEWDLFQAANFASNFPQPTSLWGKWEQINSTEKNQWWLFSLYWVKSIHKEVSAIGISMFTI